jgi:hypothetical protein
MRLLRKSLAGPIALTPSNLNRDGLSHRCEDLLI